MANRFAHLQRKVHAQTKHRNVLILLLASPLRCLRGDTRWAMGDDDSGFNFIAMLTARPRRARALHVAGSKQVIRF